MKKALTIILALIMVLTLAAGCGNVNKNITDDMGAAFDTSKITIGDIDQFEVSDPEISLRAGSAWADKGLTPVV